MVIYHGQCNLRIKMKKFSLILPVYNVEKYLPKCIESCLHQNLSIAEYEIIIIIDGSLDNSLQVARQYQQQFDCIKIVEQSNKGLSASRNTGLKRATGKYIWFIDSDDYIMPNILKGIYHVLESTKLECLWIRWSNVDTQYNIMPLYDMNIHKVSETVYSGIEFMKHVLGIYLYAWSFIYNRKFLLSNNLWFKEGMYYEDTEFAFRALPLLKHIRLYKHVCYNYVNRAGSIVNTINEKQLVDICFNMTKAHRLYINAKDKELKNFYKRSFSSFLLLVMKEVTKSKNPILKNKIIKIVRDENMKKLIPIGNKITKAIGLIYNILGIKACFAVLAILFKIKGN